jgi:hypothetical protein
MVWLQADGQKLPSSKDSLLRTALPENFEACTHTAQPNHAMAIICNHQHRLHTSPISVRLDEPPKPLPTIPAPRCKQYHSLHMPNCTATRRDYLASKPAPSAGPVRAMSVHKTKLDRAGGIEISWTSAFTHNILSIQILGIDTHTHTTFCVNDRYMSKIDRTSCFLGKVDFILLASIMSHACML